MKPELAPVSNTQVGRGALIEALHAANLPAEDVGGGARFFELRAGEAVLGFGGVEAQGTDQLLRSVVVSPTFRKQGHGARLVAALSAQARADGAERLWLLTMSARSYFESLGWQTVERSSAPPSIQNARQFTRLCPSSAVLMCRTLR